jgi:hypothetical protein
MQVKTNLLYLTLGAGVVVGAALIPVMNTDAGSGMARTDTPEARTAPGETTRGKSTTHDFSLEAALRETAGQKQAGFETALDQARFLIRDTQEESDELVRMLDAATTEAESTAAMARFRQTTKRQMIQLNRLLEAYPDAYHESEPPAELHDEMSEYQREREKLDAAMERFLEKHGARPQIQNELNRIAVAFQKRDPDLL